MGYWWKKDDIEFPVTCDGCEKTMESNEHMHVYGDDICGISVILCDKCAGL